MLDYSQICRYKCITFASNDNIFNGFWFIKNVTSCLSDAEPQHEIVLKMVPTVFSRLVISHYDFALYIYYANMAGYQVVFLLLETGTNY